MALSFTHLSYWLWGRKDHESANSAINLSSDVSGFRELESVKFPSVNGHRMRSPSRRIKRKWQSREERRLRIDREYDMVIVPSDGGCFSGSESDDSDWSVGWIEPYGPNFQSDASEADASFAVLVPCYGGGRCEKSDFLKSHALGAVAYDNGFSSEANDYVERWLSSLQNM
ncbi:hypothetical protein AXF42_Ash001649 [Apostasia shenzhenica]|uniref:Uncharacterized protein n=1 Tax=Apostasia shenzhenica TaxID=1088818 RepID=A0A2I0AAU1_9ASPA|nr:hypothetical protein AXF42_Ash001649 [Apostasia shenzhenica]